jgi:lipopolysaccharide biosynthesis glycosyltransferase
MYSALINSEELFPKLILANVNEMLSPANQGLAKRYSKILGFELEILELKFDIELKFQFHFNMTIYSRIMLMEILDEEFLWLDSDLLLLPGWTKIFEEKVDSDSEDVVLRGALDSEFHRAKLIEEKNRSILDNETHYVNSGVLFMNPQNWRKISHRQEWKLMAQRPQEYGINPNDQDILNLLCRGKVALISKNFNYIVGENPSCRDVNVIHHYAGPPKPWCMSQMEKEFFLSTQGINYFKNDSWISFYADTFLFYPQYWRLEDELIKELQLRDIAFKKLVANVRETHVHSSMDFFMKLKYYGACLVLRKWR